MAWDSCRPRCFAAWRKLPSGPNSPTPPPAPRATTDIYFADQTNGWSARGIDSVYRTTNSGLTWTKVIANTSPVAHFRSIGFASATRGWAGNLGPGSYDGSVTDTNMLYETFDGGATWSVVPGINESGMKGFCAMHVMDAQHIYGVGRVRGPAYFAKSENGGTSWAITNLTAAGVMGGLMDVYFKDTQNGFIVGMNTNLFTVPPYYGSIARTTNGGQTWQVLVTTPVASSYFWKMSWPSPNVGYASLQQNASYNTVVFYKTTDGGTTWVSNGIPLSAIGSPSSFALQGIGFVNETEGWMGGSSSTSVSYEQSFIHTTDGGQTWTPTGYNNTRSINRVRFTSPMLGYMSGQQLHVYHVPLAATVTPANPSAPLGGNVTLTATAYGTAPLHYQWRHAGTNLSGATGGTLSLTNVQLSHAGNYDVIVSDFSGAITSSVASLSLTGLPVGPTILTPPQSQVVNAGANASFHVHATSSLPLFYQWRFNGSAITGATNSAFTRTNAQPSHAGSYTVQITNSLGSIVSDAARLAFAFSDNFDNYSTPVTVTSPATTNGYQIVFNAAAGATDFKAIFGFDYSTVVYPTPIPPAPYSTGSTTKGLYLTVNKDGNGQLCAVNLYPTNNALAGNFALKFDLWMNWSTLGISAEHIMFGLNHSATVTNRPGLAPSDGLLFLADADGNIASGSSALRDYSIYRGDENAAPVMLTSANTTFGPTPLLGANFDNLDAGISSLFPAKTIAGWGTSPVGSIGLGWVNVEVRQVNSLITWLLNGKALAQFTNTTAYSDGRVMIGYYDGFVSIGNTNSFAVIDNLRVEGIQLAPVQLLAPTISSNTFRFRFATEPYATYTVQETTDLLGESWMTHTNLVGTGNEVELALPAHPSQPHYFRVRQP
ncbi:MAG: immunoglobulin domain-containing protein [Verrucomicrobiota bacterium]